MTFVTPRTRVTRDGLQHGFWPVGRAGALLLGSGTASLAHVVVRMPGEHRIDGHLAAAEVQLRYRTAEGAAINVAIPVEKGADSPAIEGLLKGTLDEGGLLRRPRDLLLYQGGETIPPFDTSVMWLVARIPVTARTHQLVGLLDQHPLPPRRLQAARGRPILRVAAKVVRLHVGDPAPPPFPAVTPGPIQPT